MPNNHNPDLSHLPKDDFGRPILPDGEFGRNWMPIRDIIDERGYDIAHVFNSGWMVRVANPDFGNDDGNPAVAVIHVDVIPDLHAAMGGGAPEEDQASLILGYWDTYLEEMGDADQAFNEATKQARRVRNRARREANGRMLDALARWEKGITDA